MLGAVPRKQLGWPSAGAVEGPRDGTRWWPHHDGESRESHATPHTTQPHKPQDSGRGSQTSTNTIAGGADGWMMMMTRADLQGENERCAIAGSFDDRKAVKQTRDPEGWIGLRDLGWWWEGIRKGEGVCQGWECACQIIRAACVCVCVCVLLLLRAAAGPEAGTGSCGRADWSRTFFPAPSWRVDSEGPLSQRVGGAPNRNQDGPEVPDREELRLGSTSRDAVAGCGSFRASCGPSLALQGCLSTWHRGRRNTILYPRLSAAVHGPDTSNSPAPNPAPACVMALASADQDATAQGVPKRTDGILGRPQGMTQGHFGEICVCVCVPQPSLHPSISSIPTRPPQPSPAVPPIPTYLPPPRVNATASSNRG